jgi:prepilin-type N-terminal cleavage/methylation domain-containing protein
MSLARRTGRGFSLTEILMAVGILGIGMTMVASIFPVAVDQTRRANDSTMAALCARSMAATIRAKRAEFVNAHRTYFSGLMMDTPKLNDRERPAEFGVPTTEYTGFPVTNTKRNPGLLSTTADIIIAKNLRVYNPNMFLYEAGRRYDTEKPNITTPFWPMWNAGNYVPVVYVTPIVPTDARIYNTTGTTPITGLYNTDGGPFRVTIVVFKSRGHSTGFIYGTVRSAGDALHPRTKTWNENAKVMTTGEPTFAAGAGDYVIDRTRHSGEAYLIDFANLDPLKTPPPGGVTGNALNPPLLLACGVSASSARAALTTVSVTAASAGTAATATNGLWYPLPGAVAVFHTIIGD